MQMTGILSARNIISKIDRDDLLEALVKSYLKKAVENAGYKVN